MIRNSTLFVHRWVCAMHGDDDQIVPYADSAPLSAKLLKNDVPNGKVTDFRRAVQANEEEAVVFSWVEWPDKATRDAAMARMEDLMKNDPRMNPETNPMPFDGKRMIYGGFSPVVTLEK